MASSGRPRSRQRYWRSLQRARKQPYGPRPPPDRTVRSARPSDVVALRGARHDASADQASAAGDGRITPAALLLLGAESHAANAPAHTQPSTTRQPNAHAAGKARKQAGRAQAARALGKHNSASCGVRAGSPTARGHCRIAPLALSDHQASQRCGGPGRAALLPTRRALPPTADSLAALLLLGAQSHSTDAPAHTQPSKRRQRNAHAEEQAQKRVGRAHAARALGKHYRASCGVRAGSPTARGHCRIAPLALSDHQASQRCGGRGRAALLPTRRAPPSTAESLQLRAASRRSEPSR